MKYFDGQEVRLEDRVKLGEDHNGTVVCIIDTDEYTTEHPKSAWSYLKKGLMVEFPKYGLIHYDEPEEDLQLLGRKQSQRASI
jgi:hypothetical protein